MTVKLNLTGDSVTPALGRPIGETYNTHCSTAMALGSLLFAAGARRVRFVESAQSREVQGENFGGKLGGEVEVDETFIGGKARNMHADKRAERITGTGPEGKAIVAAVLQRGGKIHAKVVSTRRKPELQALVREHVEVGSTVYSDALKSYEAWKRTSRIKLSTMPKPMSMGEIHTNNCENCWSLLKRGINGTYVMLSHSTLFRDV